MVKRILLILLVVFVAAQFFQPDRSAPTADPTLDMLVMTNAPQDIRDLVTGACYDCHSYATQYPWYVHITPVNFIMQRHIDEGREHLNFSRWDKYAGSKDAGECGEMIQKGEMPPGYYKLMHAHGRLTDAQQQVQVAWFAANIPGEGRAETGEGQEPVSSQHMEGDEEEPGEH